MGKVVKLRRTGKSVVLTIPQAIREMYGLTEGGEVEILPFTSDTLQLKVKRS
ncbi:MAG: AbrB/MazE/SpoVT family DNA-binding domain-containing protein [Methanosarcinales archaeon]